MGKRVLRADLKFEILHTCPNSSTMATWSQGLDAHMEPREVALLEYERWPCSTPILMSCHFANLHNELSATFGLVCKEPAQRCCSRRSWVAGDVIRTTDWVQTHAVCELRCMPLDGCIQANATKCA